MILTQSPSLSIIYCRVCTSIIVVELLRVYLSSFCPYVDLFYYLFHSFLPVSWPLLLFLPHRIHWRRSRQIVLSFVTCPPFLKGQTNSGSTFVVNSRLLHSTDNFLLKYVCWLNWGRTYDKVSIEAMAWAFFGHGSCKILMEYLNSSNSLFT